MLVDPKLKAMRDAIYDDMQRNGGSGDLPIDVLRDWKTRLGGLINWTGFGSSDPQNGAFKLLWGALKDDIMTGTAQIDPKLAPMIQNANQQYAVAQAQLQNVGRVVNKAGGPEKVFTSLMAGNKDGATQLNQVLSQLDPAGRQLLAATQLQRMGLANASAQGAAGGDFSAATLLTNWNRMHPDARAAMFGQLPNSYSQNVTKLAHDAEILRTLRQGDAEQLWNSSSTDRCAAALRRHPGGCHRASARSARNRWPVWREPSHVLCIDQPQDDCLVGQAY